MPIAFLVAAEWQPAGRQLVRVVDGLHALTLGVAYFLLAWAMLTERGAPDMAGVDVMIGLEDAENLFLLGGAHRALGCCPTNTAERDLFRSLGLYLRGLRLADRSEQTT